MRRRFAAQPALFGVALIADLVDAIRFEQWLGCRAMRVMAVDTAHLAFWQGHVGALLEVGPLLWVTGGAGLGDVFSTQCATERLLHHRVVAVAAGDLVVVVGRADPVQALPALVAAQTLRILLLDWSAPVARETDDERVVPGLLRMP